MPDNQPKSLPENQTAKGNPYSQFMSATERAKDYSEFSAATFEQRLMAYTIDYLLLGILGKAISSLVGGTVSTSLAMILAGVYFFVAHLKYQRTIGKHLLGLRVVSLDPMQPLTAMRLFLREGVGRLVSTLTLGIGYLLPLVTDERRALHDYAGSSRVVSLKPVREVSVFLQLIRGVGSIGALAAVFAGISYYVIFYTTYPLTRMQKSYYAKGVRLKGISGNITSGFMIKRIDWEEDGEKIEFEDLFIDVDAQITSLIKEDYHIRKVSVARANLVFKRDEKAIRDARTEDDRPVSVTKPTKTKARSKITVPRFRMDELDLKNLSLDLAGREILLKRFFVGDLESQGKKFAIGRMYIDSSDLALNMTGFELNDENLKTEGPVQILVRQGLIPDVLRSDLDLNLSVHGKWPDVNVEAAAFRQKLTVNRGETKTRVALSDWSPGHYLRGYWPVHKLNLKFDGSGDLKTMLLTTPITGSMSLQHIPYQMSANQTLLTIMARGLIFQHQRGAYINQVLVQPMLATKGGWMKMVSTHQMSSAEEELAYLYYGETEATLDESRRARVRADVRFFNDPLIPTEALAKLSGVAGGLTESVEAPEDLSPNVQRGPSNESDPND